MAARDPSIALVSLPWTTLAEPSLGLGILRSVLDQAGIPARVHHLQIELLRWLNPATYIAIANVFALNDFLFSGSLDPSMTRDQQWLLRDKTSELLSCGLIDDLRWGGIDGVMAHLIELRRSVLPAWLDEVADRLAAAAPTLIGFTCMFDQTVASIALARRVKLRAPAALVALGGYAVRAPTAHMLLRSFPWIDAICTGEGEPAIVGLATASVGACQLREVSNLIIRDDDGAPRETAIARRVDLETAPPPSYDDFYTDIAALATDHAVDIEVTRLPVENSRGCWWGATHHCVFCGIHDDDLAYRSRSAPAVLAMLDALARRYRVTSFRFSDYILPHVYHRTLVPALIERGAPYVLTCEIKANLTPEQMQGLARSGFTAVQPGIESFSTSVLRRMKKGVTAIQNVHTLLLGKQYGVHIDYNLLYGMPGDEEHEYGNMVKYLPRLFHLDAPATRIAVQVTRYAPLATDPGRFGLMPSHHEPSYDLVFSQDYLAQTGFDLDMYCYYFDRGFENPPRLARLFRRIDEIVDAWKVRAERDRPALWYALEAGAVTVEDSRLGPTATHRLGDRAGRLLLGCEAPTRIELADPLTAGALDELDRLGLVFVEGNKLVSLALPRPDQDPAAVRCTLGVTSDAAAVGPRRLPVVTP
jgi:ribosomal peptide maturation radical SAM protein 1